MEMAQERDEKEGERDRFEFITNPPIFLTCFSLLPKKKKENPKCLVSMACLVCWTMYSFPLHFLARRLPIKRLTISNFYACKILYKDIITR